MPLSDGGKYFSNPALAKREDSLGDAPTSSAEEQQSESPAVSHHIFKTGEGFHSTSHHQDGSAQDMDHASLDEALQRSKEIFQDDGQDSDEAQEQQEDLGSDEDKY